MSNYRFRREDNGQIVEISFLEMMEKDAMGCITLADGVVAREIRPSCRSVEPAGNTSGVAPQIVSDALGFTERQFQDFEQDRVANGFTGIEFIRDPAVPQFFRVKCNAPSQWQAYIRHRNACDHNSQNGSGSALTPEALKRAEELVRRTTVDEGQAVAQDG